MYLGQLICPTFPEVRKYLVVNTSFLASLARRSVHPPKIKISINTKPLPVRKKTGTGAGNTVKNSPL
jgi:hypothetical protein